GFGTDPGDLLQVGDRGPFDRLEGAEVTQQRAFSGGADAGDFLQTGFAQVAPAPLAVGADREAMGLVAQPFDEIEHWIARLELERLTSRHEEGFPPRVALGTFGDGNERNVADAKAIEGFACGGELAEAAVDKNEAGPGRLVVGFVRRTIESGRGRL